MVGDHSSCCVAKLSDEGQIRTVGFFLNMLKWMVERKNRVERLNAIPSTELWAGNIDSSCWTSMQCLSSTMELVDKGRYCAWVWKGLHLFSYSEQPLSIWFTFFLSHRKNLSWHIIPGRKHCLFTPYESFEFQTNPDKVPLSCHTSRSIRAVMIWIRERS